MGDQTGNRDFVLGKEISFDDGERAIFVDDRGEYYHYLGFLDADDRFRVKPFGVLRRHWRKLKDSPSFVRVQRGCVHLDWFFSSKVHADKHFDALQHLRVELPDGAAKMNYGVINVDSHSQDSKATEAIFGVAQHELDEFLADFSSALQFRSPGDKKPCTTRSRRWNICELSNAWIPELFPYISHGGQGDFGAHISLSGYYAFVAYLCKPPRLNRARALLKSNAVRISTVEKIERAAEDCESPILSTRYGWLADLS